MVFILIGTFFLCMLVSMTVVIFATKPGQSQKTVHDRLNVIGNKLMEVAESERLQLSAKVTRESFTDRISERFASYRFGESLEMLILYSGSKASVGSIVLSSVGVAGVLAIAAHWFSGPIFVVIAIGAVGAVIPYFLLSFKKKSRLKKFETALPDAIELMARALRAGHSMASAIEIIAQQSPEPLSTEFASCFQQQKFGIPFRDALTAMGNRVPSNDLHFLITAVLVQKETGGDLTDILDRTTHVIRERVRIAGEIRTYTAQGRLTGWILSLMPVAMMGIINVLTPGYSHVLFVDPIGQALIGIGVGLIAIGAFIISRIVDIKV